MGGPVYDPSLDVMFTCEECQGKGKTSLFPSCPYCGGKGKIGDRRKMERRGQPTSIELNGLCFFCRKPLGDRPWLIDDVPACENCKFVHTEAGGNPGKFLRMRFCNVEARDGEETKFRTAVI